MVNTTWVDPVTGNDRFAGDSPRTAKRTIQAAVDTAPRGGEIILAPGVHRGGFTCDDNTKALTIRGATPLMSRQHADGSSNQAYITTGKTGDDRPDTMFSIGTPDSGHVYGWTFKHLYINADSVSDTGSVFRTHGVNKAWFEDVAARALNVTARYLVRADGGAGDDASWWHFNGVNTSGLALAASKDGNYWTFNAVQVHAGWATRPQVPALDLEGSQHNLSGLNIEGFITGVRATGCRGILGQGIMGESVNTMVHLVNCVDSIISVNSAAGYGHSEVLDEGGRNNIVIGAPHRKTGGTTGAVSVGEYGTTFVQTAAGSANLIHGEHPTRPSPGVELLPSGMFDIVGAGPLTAEYWDGERWLPWGASTGVLPVANGQSVTVDAAHRRVRFRTRNLARAVTGLATARTRQPHGEPSRYTFRLLNWAATRVLEEHAVTTDSPAQTKGATVSFATEGAIFEFEADFGLTGDQIATVSRLHLFTPAPDPDMPGKQLRGHAAPEGIIHGAPGDTYHSTGDPGLWVHIGPTGLTGWRKLAYA